MKICKRFSECFPGSSWEYKPVRCALRGYVCRDYEAETESEPQVIEHIHRHSDMGKKEFGLLQQLVLKADYLEKRLNEIRSDKKSIKYIIRT